MSRSLIVILILLIVLVAGAVLLSRRTGEVPTQRIEQDVTNEAMAR